MHCDYWYQSATQAEAELDEARTRSTVNAAAANLESAQLNLRAIITVGYQPLFANLELSCNGSTV